MRRLFVLAVGLIALALPARAEERITDFLSHVTVNADSSLTVRETIAVEAEGHEIKRGILRDFPTTYPDRAGQRVTVGFEVLDVERDGRKEPFALEALDNGTRVRIGDKDVFLERGQHRYAITYRTTRQIGFFEDYDELYWNVTGHGWTLPIDRARVTIRLPEGAQISRQAEYTGREGSKDQDAQVIAAVGNSYEAETTRRLEPGEGLTVALAWQKGLVTPPGQSRKLAWWLSDNAGFFALGLGLVAAAGYFLFAWNRVGRDPAKGTIIPLFRPPEGLGPACLRYVMNYGSDQTGLAAALVGLAVKGRLRIADDGDGFSVTKLGLAARGAALTSSEQALLDALPAGSTVLKQANHAKVGAAKLAFEAALQREYEGTVFVRNLNWFAGGLAISVICLVTGALLLPKAEAATGLFAMLWMGVWWGAIISFGWAALKGVIARRGLWGKISSLAGLVFLVPFIGAGVIAPALMILQHGLTPALATLAGSAAALGLVNVIFYHLLRAPTEKGRRLLDQIEGFRLYLSTAEEERLKVLHPPEKTPELFERYLPYAMALGCENEWNAKFATVLAAAAAAGATAPVWYSGRHWDVGRGGFTESLGRSLAASAAAASAPPGRSSGSGGGGFSGGGGGGGGGSGW